MLNKTVATRLGKLNYGKTAVSADGCCRLEKELARLERNKERRIARDKQKGIHVEVTNGEPGSPSSATPAAKTGGTQRKCANCGQVGHIKTNKKFHPESP